TRSRTSSSASTCTGLRGPISTVARIPEATLTALKSGTLRSSARARAAVEESETTARARAQRGMGASVAVVISGAFRFQRQSHGRISWPRFGHPADAGERDALISADLVRT